MTRFDARPSDLKKFFFIVAVLIGLAVLDWRTAYPTYTWHEKLTIDISVDGKVYSGSSVVAHWMKVMPQILPESGIRKYGTRGEAAVVELPNGKYVFALLYGTMAYSVFKDKFNFEGGDETIPAARAFSKLRETREIPPDKYPRMVTFGDIRDPKSVMKVDKSNLASVVGTDARIARMTLEITAEDISTGRVRDILPWIDDYYDKMLDGDRLESSRAKDHFANSLTPAHFVKD